MLEKQGRARNEMGLHLMPTRREQEEWEWEAGNEAEEEASASMASVGERLEGVEGLVHAF